MGHRAWVSAASAALALTVVAAAGGLAAGPSGSPGVDASLAPATVELWATNAGDIHSKAIEDSAARFNAAHPGVKIKPVIIPAPYPDKVAVAMSGGNPPQIYAGFGGGTLQAQVEAGKVYALDDALGKYPGWFDQFFPGVLKNAVVDGKTYAIPMNGIQPVVLFYSKPLFEKYGVKPPTTWDELMAAVETFKSNGIIPISIAGVRTDAWTELMWLEYLVDRNGGPEPFNNAVAGKADAWKDPAFLKAAQMIKQLVDAGAFGDTFSSVSYANGQSDALIYTDKAAMQLQGTWDYDIMKGAAQTSSPRATTASSSSRRCPAGPATRPICRATPRTSTPSPPTRPRRNSMLLSHTCTTRSAPTSTLTTS